MPNQLAQMGSFAFYTYAMGFGINLPGIHFVVVSCYLVIGIFGVNFYPRGGSKSSKCGLNEVICVGSQKWNTIPTKIWYKVAR